MSQPAPVANKYPTAWDIAIDSLKEAQKQSPTKELKRLISRIIKEGKKRDKIGRERYGVPLQPFNGRNAKIDCLEEMLDAFVYATQHDYEETVLSKKKGKPEPEPKLSVLIGSTLMLVFEMLKTKSH